MLTSRDTGSCTIETLDTENMGIAVEILLLCALEFEICLGGVKIPPVAGERRKKIVAGTRVKGDCWAMSEVCALLSALLVDNVIMRMRRYLAVIKQAYDMCCNHSDNLLIYRHRHTDSTTYPVSGLSQP